MWKYWSTLRIQNAIHQPYKTKKKKEEKQFCILHFQRISKPIVTALNNIKKEKKSKHIWLKAKQNDIHMRDNNNINHDCSKLNCMIIVIRSKH